MLPHSLPTSRFRAPNADSALHNRASLLGPHDYYSTPPSSGRSSPFGGAGGSGSGHGGNPYGAGQRFADDLEGQNDEALEGLTAKVKILKDVSESACGSGGRNGVAERTYRSR